MCTKLITVSGGFLGEGSPIAENSIHSIRECVKSLRTSSGERCRGIKKFEGVNTPCERGSGVNPAGDRGTRPQKCGMGDGNASCPPNMAEISLHSD